MFLALPKHIRDARERERCGFFPFVTKRSIFGMKHEHERGVFPVLSSWEGWLEVGFGMFAFPACHGR